MKFLCERCKAKYQIPDEKVAGKTVRMKCRKCEHLIEVRAAVTETSVAASAKATGVSPPKAAPMRPAPPRAAPAPRDEWYASIDGEHVGPVRAGELRARALGGALTEDSLVWRDGMAHWQPLHTVPTLLVMVREVTSSRRAAGSTTAARRATPAKGVPSATPAQSAPAGRPRAPQVTRPSPALAAPVASRLATAERLDLAPLTREQPEPVVASSPAPLAHERVSVAPDPFAPKVEDAAPAVAAPSAAVAPPAAREQILDPKKGPPPYLLMGMMLGFMSFGAVAGYAIFFPPPPLPAQPPTVQTVYLPAIAPPVTAPLPTPAPSHAAPKGTARAHAKPAPSASGPAAPAVSIDVGTLPSQPSLGPMESPQAPSTRPSVPGGSLTAQQIESVQRSHLLALKRKCVDQGAPGGTSSNVVVHITVGGNGQVTSATATGNDAATARCAEKDVMRWGFPPTGGQSVIDMPLHFVRQ